MLFASLFICIRADGKPQASTITVRHRPTCEDEKNRIEKAGGAVFSGRVFGALAVSRSVDNMYCSRVYSQLS